MIECQDGKYYESPLWYGRYGSEELRWVIKDFQVYAEVMKKRPAGLKGGIVTALAAASFENYIVEKGGFEEYAIFPPNWTRALAYLFPLTLEAPPPVPQEFKGIFDVPDFTDLKHCWNVMFPTATIWAFFGADDEKKLDIRLGSFVLGEPIWKYDVGFRVRVQRLLPDLTRFSLAEAIEHHGEYIRISRARPSFRKKHKQRSPGPSVASDSSRNPGSQ